MFLIFEKKYCLKRPKSAKNFPKCQLHCSYKLCSYKKKKCRLAKKYMEDGLVSYVSGSYLLKYLDNINYQASGIFKLPPNALPNLPPKRVMRQLRKGINNYFYLNCSLLYYYSLLIIQMTCYIPKNINNRPKKRTFLGGKNIIRNSCCQRWVSWYTPPAEVSIYFIPWSWVFFSYLMLKIVSYKNISQSRLWVIFWRVV